MKSFPQVIVEDDLDNLDLITAVHEELNVPNQLILKIKGVDVMYFPPCDVVNK